MFGGASSPSCANYALNKTAEDNKEDFDPVTVKTVRQNFYVAGCLRSVGTDSKAICLVGQLRDSLSRGAFRMTKWISNSKKVINSIHEDLCHRKCGWEEPVPESSNRKWEAGLKDLPKIERFKTPQCFRPPNFNEVQQSELHHFADTSDQGYGAVSYLRQIDTNGKIHCSLVMAKSRLAPLSIICSVYDPLGFISPCIVPAKLIQQDLCHRKFGWDELVPESSNRKWEAWLKDLPKLERFKIPRCFRPPNFNEVQQIELHHFANTSD